MKNLTKKTGLSGQLKSQINYFVKYLVDTKQQLTSDEAYSLLLSRMYESAITTKFKRRDDTVTSKTRKLKLSKQLVLQREYALTYIRTKMRNSTYAFPE